MATFSFTYKNFLLQKAVFLPRVRRQLKNSETDLMTTKKNWDFRFTSKKFFGTILLLSASFFGEKIIEPQCLENASNLKTRFCILDLNYMDKILDRSFANAKINTLSKDWIKIICNLLKNELKY